MLTDDDKTPILCLACGGKYEIVVDYIHLDRCQWCFRGQMSETSLEKWKQHQALLRNSNSTVS
jgi:hypothetical protein